MTRSSESRAQRASRRGSIDNETSGSSKNDDGNINDDEREQVAREEERGRSRRRRRSPGKNKYGAKAVAENAANHGRGGEDVMANDVLGAFYNMLLQGAPPQQGGNGQGGSNREEGSIHIDLRKASNVLEAAAGNLALAANLYWDDYFATQAANQFNAAADRPPNLDAGNAVVDPKKDRSLNQENKNLVVARGPSFRFEQHHNIDVGRSDYCDSSDLKKRSIHLAADYPTPSKRRLRRSLDSDFQAADDDDETKKKKRAAKRARKSNEYAGKAKTENECLDNNDDMNEDDHKMPANRRHGNQEDDENEREERPPSRRRINRSNDIRHQDIVQADTGVKNGREPSENSDDNEENGDKNNERSRRHRGRRRGRRVEPRRVFAQVGVEKSISVSDDELGRVGHSHNLKTASRRRGDRDLNREQPITENSRSSKSKKNDSTFVSRSAVMKAVNAIHRKINPNTTHLSKPSTWFLSPEQRSRKNRREHDNDDDSVVSNPEDYISDDDWLGGETYSTPLECLWGVQIDEDHSSPLDRIEIDQNRNNEGSNGNVVADVSGEDEDGYDNNRSSFRSASATSGQNISTGIPHMWLNAGFQLSECGSGLVVKSPSVDDIEFFSWRQQQVNDKRSAIPPPYHCKALTAITSIVTGMLYIGASIQGSEVNYTSGKPPWSSLSAEERKRQFDSRLADALSSLIFVAAQASLKRKRKAYRKAIRVNKPMNDESKYSNFLREVIAERKAALAVSENENGDDNIDDVRSGKENDVPTGGINNIDAMSAVVEDNVSKHSKRCSKKKTMASSQEKKELMRRRLDLIPTCVWADKKAATASRAGDGPLFNSNISIKTSWTNIRDIELYVKSNLRTFTEKGGIALFLETIIRIHGKDFITRQLNRPTLATTTSSASVSSGEEKKRPNFAIEVPESGITEKSKCCKPNTNYPSLIRCTCEDRQKLFYEKNPLPLNIRIDPSKLLDTTPSGTECISTELLTLLLTGRVNSDLKDCSSEKLGIGLLTEIIGEVSRGFARPEQPVWLLKGDACYSVLTVDGSWNGGDSSGSQSRAQLGFGTEHYRKDYLKTISKVDKPGAPLNMCHWNGWYGQRNKTGMRLVISSLRKDVPSKKLLSQFSEQDDVNNTKRSLLQRRRHESLINAISVEEHNYNEIKAKDNPIRPSELERIKIHLDDQKLYPRNHNMWRFDLGARDVSPTMDVKPVAINWVPYFQLTSRQKKMVEIKLGPKINTILWTRWPDAVIDNFTPCKGGFPIV